MDQKELDTWAIICCSQDLHEQNARLEVRWLEIKPGILSVHVVAQAEI